MQDLVGVRVPDAAEQTRIGERSLDRVILAAKSRGEVAEVGVQHLESAAVELRERVRALDDVNGRASLRPRLGEVEVAGIELERGLRELAGDLLPAVRATAVAPRS